MIKKGDEISVDVIELSSEGKGISKLEDGFVIFSTSTLPGDEALIKIVRKKSKYAEANLVELKKNSPFRIDPRCNYFGICGGCKIQNYTYEKQVEYKTKVVADAFQRIGGFSGINVPAAIKSDDIFFYRNKMEFSFSDDEWNEIPPDARQKNKFKKDSLPHSHEDTKSNNQTEEDSEPSYLSSENIRVGNRFALGLHVPKFHSKIVDIKKCFLQSELSNDILNFTRDFFKSKKVSVYSTKTQTGFLRFLIIRECKNTKDVMVNLVTYNYDEALMNEYSESMKKNFPGISTLINSISDKKAQVASGEKEYVLFGNGYITEKLKTSSNKEYIFNLSPQSFFQTNTLQAQKLFDTAASLADLKNTDNVLDLYCGAGAITIYISDKVNKVLGVELSEDAINDARKNSHLNKVDNAEFIVSDIKDFLESENVNEYSKLILDPPRAGLHPKICEILSETNFEKIIYVSCNPHTQARDLQIICAKEKYAIEKIQPVDMFPHTYHIENIVSLKRCV